LKYVKGIAKGKGLEDALLFSQVQEPTQGRGERGEEGVTLKRWLGAGIQLRQVQLASTVIVGKFRETDLMLVCPLCHM
jgi:hypothetical protein